MHRAGRSVVPTTRSRVPGLPGAGERVRGRRGHQRPVDALDERRGCGAAAGRVDDAERLRFSRRAGPDGPRLRRCGCGAGCVAGRGHEPSRLGETVRRGSRRRRPHAGDRRPAANCRRSDAAQVRMEHRGSVAAILAQSGRRSPIDPRPSRVPGAPASRCHGIGGRSTTQRHRHPASRGASGRLSGPVPLRRDHGHRLGRPRVPGGARTRSSAP